MVQGKFWEVFVPIFTMGNAIGSLTVKCFRFVCENLTFPFGKRIVGKLDMSAFWDIFSFKMKVGINEKLAKNVTIVLQNLWPTQQSCQCNMHIHE